MAAVIQVKRGTASSWTSANPILAAGEVGFETDTKKMKVGDGTTAWTSLTYTATDGDISGVTAGTGLSGGGTSGSVTVSLDTTSQYVVPSQTTHSGKYLTTDGTTSSWGTVDLSGKTDKSTLSTTGDIYYASAANTPARLGIGSTGQVLTVSGGIPTWATATAGGATLLTDQTLGSVNTYTYNSIPQTYNDLAIYVWNYRPSGAYDGIALRLNANTGSNYNLISDRITNVTATTVTSQTTSLPLTNASINYNDGGNFAYIYIPAYTLATNHLINYQSVYMAGGGDRMIETGTGQYYGGPEAITSVTLLTQGGTNLITNARIQVYGVK